METQILLIPRLLNASAAESYSYKRLPKEFNLLKENLTLLRKSVIRIKILNGNLNIKTSEIQRF
jgi:hypothetical protein